MTPEFSLVLDSQCALGESPVWWAERAYWYSLTLPGRRLHRFDPQSGRHEVDALAEDIGCVAPARSGGYVAGMHSGIWLLNASGERRRKLADNAENLARNRFSDGRSTQTAAISPALLMSRRPAARRGSVATIGAVSRGWTLGS